MRKINLLVMVLSALLIVVLAGCESKNDKMREFLHAYGNETIEKAYLGDGFHFPNNELITHKFAITSVDIKDVKTKEGSDVKYHFVRAKIVYSLTFTNSDGEKGVWVVYRWMQLTIEEDGFGNLLVDVGKSREELAMGGSEKDMRDTYPSKVEKGEKLIE